MIEMKAISSGEIYNIIEYEGSCITDDLYYPKSEADKVIAELKGQVNGFKNRSNLWHYNAVEEHKKFVQADKVIAHNKYKRCLAMAELCHWKAAIFIYKKEKNDFYWRWYDRWKALAEKFKEAK